MQDYHDDSPLDGDKGDLFGRLPYAKKIADVLANLDKDSSYVVGLYSKWGYGKTSTINMIKKSLENISDVEILDLEPWNYSSDKELAANLLYELMDKLGILPKTKQAKGFFRRKSQAISGAISQVSSSASFKPNDNVTIGAGNIAGTTLLLINLLSSTRGYKSQRQEIEKTLQENGKHLVVFIDDIDRLDSEKILNVFKLVKSVANIRGVTYFLSFDEQIVADSISESLPKKQGGKEYVDKIIQIPIVLPLIDRSDLDKYVDEKIEGVLSQNRIRVEEDEWRDLQLVYQQAKQKLDTPRSVNRFSNSLLFAIPLIKDEVNIVDLVSIELLRVTYPELYERIRNNRDLLTKVRYDDGYGSRSDEEKAKKIRREYEKAFADNQEWLDLLAIMFPNVKKHYFGGTFYGEDESSVNRKYKRLRSYEYFNRYFTYSVGKGELSDVEFFEKLESPAVNPKELTTILRKDPRRALQKIKDNKEVVTDVKVFASALVGALGSYSSSDAREPLQLDLIDNALFLIDDMLDKQSSAYRLKVYLEVLEVSNEASTVSHIIRHVNAAHNEKGADSKVLSDDEFDAFKKASIKKINELISNNKLPIDDYGTMANYLYEFMNLFEGSPNTVNGYMRQRIITSTQVVDFISQFVGKWTNLGSNKSYRSDLMDDSFSAYNFWFKDKLDTKYLYETLIKSNKYKKYVGISKDDISRFERHRNDKVNLAGNEKTPEFRDVIAQQFIFLYEQSLEANTA